MDRRTPLSKVLVKSSGLSPITVLTTLCISFRLWNIFPWYLLNILWVLETPISDSKILTGPWNQYYNSRWRLKLKPQIHGVLPYHCPGREKCGPELSLRLSRIFLPSNIYRPTTSCIQWHLVSTNRFVWFSNFLNRMVSRLPGWSLQLTCLLLYWILYFINMYICRRTNNRTTFLIRKGITNARP